MKDKRCAQCGKYICVATDPWILWNTTNKLFCTEQCQQDFIDKKYKRNKEQDE